MYILIQNQIEESIETKKEMIDFCLEDIHLACQLLENTVKNNKKILLCGNGGSAADAQHIAAELIVRYKNSNSRPSIPAISLVTDTSVLTACANDFGYEELFSRQIEGLGIEGDALIAITTSGNSKNIIKAVETAKSKNMKVILLTGKSGGLLKKKLSHLLDVSIHVPSEITARIQECHILIGHIFCEYLDQTLFQFS
ncbi:MAG: SIS domain-containing protein [Leptonema sp. (in: bacteria)]